MTADDVRALLKQKVQGAGSLKAASLDLGIGDAYLSNVLGGRFPPGLKILKKLGLRRVMTYEPIEPISKEPA
jgi:hypothetical protein